VIRVLLAEDQALVRGALASLLGLEPDLEVVAQVGRGDEVLDAVRAAEPDVAVMDIEMPGCSGLDAAALLHEHAPGVRVVIVTTFGKPAFLRRAMAEGASAFLLKDAPATELAAAIRRVMTGERVVDPGLAAAALSAPENPLTAREREVLLRARDGGTTAQIAADLHLSHGTARNHLSAIMQKLGVASRADALRMAEEQGWL
jgi:two-component system response regulator DesR